MDKLYTGRCYCGAISYTAKGAPVIVAQCHCEACRRLSGTGHSVGAMFEAEAVDTAGSVAQFHYTSDKGTTVTKAFCPDCGSPIYGTNSASPNHLTLTLGSMDDASDLTPSVAIFQSKRPHWDQIGPDAVCFDTQPDWTPNS